MIVTAFLPLMIPVPARRDAASGASGATRPSHAPIVSSARPALVPAVPEHSLADPEAAFSCPGTPRICTRPLELAPAL
jgi:hypothetical protein